MFLWKTSFSKSDKSEKCQWQKRGFLWCYAIVDFTVTDPLHTEVENTADGSH